jgi:hypothetical protein
MKLLKVLIVEQGKEPQEAEINDDLASMQKIVGGSIEVVYPWNDPVALVCNEEGKILGLPLNRSLEDYDIIAGTFFICGLSKGNFVSLAPEYMEKYKRVFYYAETFFKAEGHIQSIRIRS